MHGDSTARALDLMRACMSGDEVAARRALQRGANVDNAASEGLGGSALFRACIRGHGGVVTLLLRHGAEVDSGRSSDGLTPLHMACDRGHGAIVSLLLGHGADVDHASSSGITPLHSACTQGHAAIVTLLLGAGADVNRIGPNTYGIEALHIACIQGHEVIVSLLLEHGANADHVCVNEMTALHLACTQGHEGIVTLLLEHGATVDLAGSGGLTPLHSACHQGHEAVARRLARRGASDRYAAALARRHNHNAIAEWLEAVHGFTALHWACEARDPARVRAALRGNAVAGAPARCGVGGAGPTALELTTRPEAFPYKPSPVCAATAALVRDALAPWLPRVHHVQTVSFRTAAFTVMCVGLRLRGIAPAHARRRSRRLLQLTRAPPALPDELWMAVLACCSRGWWDVAS